MRANVGKLSCLKNLSVSGDFSKTHQVSWLGKHEAELIIEGRQKCQSERLENKYFWMKQQISSKLKNVGCSGFAIHRTTAVMFYVWQPGL